MFIRSFTTACCGFCGRLSKADDLYVNRLNQEISTSLHIESIMLILVQFGVNIQRINFIVSKIVLKVTMYCISNHIILNSFLFILLELLLHRSILVPLFKRCQLLSTGDHHIFCSVRSNISGSKCAC